MNVKKQSGKKRLFLLVLVAFGIVLWITFTNLNRIALRHTLDETIGFVKIRLEQYETDAANDRVKSLVRLLDKTVSLGNEMTLKEGFGTQDLNSFAEEQRLTGALVLDENLNVVMQTTKDGNAMPLWEKLIDSPYVHNIVDYPKKTYSTRLEENGILYDFAAVARADAPGILITYIQKDNEDIGDLTVDSLLRDFPLELGGIATITENGRVISSNSSKQVNKAIEDCQELYNGTFGAAEDGIVRLNSNQGVWYGSRENTENYALFVFFPASQVFMTRNIVCASYLAIAVMVFLMALLWQTKMEKDALRQHQKRTGIITALGTAYTSISLVDLKKNTVEIVKNASEAEALCTETIRTAGANRENYRGAIPRGVSRLYGHDDSGRTSEGSHLFGSYVSDCRQKMDPYADHTAAKRRGRQRNSRIGCYPRRYRGKAAGAKAGGCPARCTGGGGTRQ